MNTPKEQNSKLKFVDYLLKVYNLVQTDKAHMYHITGALLDATNYYKDPDIKEYTPIRRFYAVVGAVVVWSIVLFLFVYIVQFWINFIIKL